MVHIFVATPAYGEAVTSAYFSSFVRLMAMLPGRRIAISHNFRFSSLLPRARSELVANFLERTDTTYLLFWDADIGIDPMVLFEMLDFHKPVVGLDYPKKEYHWSRLRQPSKLPLPDRLMDLTAQYTEPPERSGKFRKALRVGSGFLLIERSVFKIISESMPELSYIHRGRKGYAFFDTAIDPETRQYISEDFAFCDRVRRCGGEIWCHVDAPVLHVGVHTFKYRANE